MGRHTFLLLYQSCVERQIVQRPKEQIYHFVQSCCMMKVVVYQYISAAHQRINVCTEEQLVRECALYVSTIYSEKGVQTEVWATICRLAVLQIRGYAQGTTMADLGDFCPKNISEKSQLQVSTRRKYKKVQPTCGQLLKLT